MPSVNRIFPLRVLTAGAISLFLNITGAIAPMAPVLNTPLIILLLQNHEIAGITNSEIKKFGDPVLSISLLESQNSLLRKYIVKITVFCIFVSLCVLAVVNNASLHLT